MHGQACTEKDDVAFDELSRLARVRLQELVDDGGLYADAMEYIKRLEYELKVFQSSGYSSIILIISDYIRWARENDVVVGPGRGSAAGSLVVFLVGITSLDPIRFGLIFERFLNPNRISLPDIDTDFSSRDSVIEYLKKKYGRNRVVRVGIPSLFKPRSAIDEFCRALQIDFEEAKRINKLVGDSPTFKEAFVNSPDLCNWQAKYPELFQLAERVQGYVRMSTTHPSAVILTKGPIGKEIPLQRSRGEKGDLVTQWDGEELDELGYVKLDILTIDNLRIIDNTIKMLDGNIRPNFYDLPLDDKKTLNGFNAGETIAVFQFEEPKSVGILKGLNEITFQDICSVNACIRPGLDVSKFIEGRNDPEKVEYTMPELVPILSDTYGVILYQEQVMRMCVDLAGFTMAEADGVRKIIAKTANQRSVEGLAPIYDKFKKGYLANGLNPSKFEILWTSILSCQTYIFNRAHATCYAYIAYADMYLKQHFPLQFMCAALQTRSKEIYIKECKRLGIIVLPPHVHKSDVNYKIEGESIRVGLGNIKHLGKARKIIKNRPYRDAFDLINRAKPTKKVLMALVYGGALDCFDERIKLAYYMADEGDKPTVGHLATGEKENLGFYLKHDPLDGCEGRLNGCITPNTRQSMRGVVGGMVMRIHEHDAKTGMMVFVTVMTVDGEMDVVVWPSDYSTEQEKIVIGNVILANAKKTEKGNYSIKCIKVIRNA